jgi:hypothetical protein
MLILEGKTSCAVHRNAILPLQLFCKSKINIESLFFNQALCFIPVIPASLEAGGSRIPGQPELHSETPSERERQKERGREREKKKGRKEGKKGRVYFFKSALKS